MNELLKQWRDRYDDLREQLYIKGDQAHLHEYSLLAIEALAISQCINDLQQLMLEQQK